MNTESTNQNTAAEPTATPAEQTGGQKTFTQEQLNAIVSDRLARDRQKQSEELSKKEQELAKREFRLNNRQKLVVRGYPETLLDALNCSDEKTFDAALDAIDSLVKERMPSKEQMEQWEAERKAAGSAPRYTAPSEHRNSGFDMIKAAMGL